MVFPEELEDLLSFKAEKSMKLLGFARTEQSEDGLLSIQRHHYMKARPAGAAPRPSPAHPISRRLFCLCAYRRSAA